MLNAHALDARSAFGREARPVCPCCPDAERLGTLSLDARGAAHTNLPVGTLVCEVCHAAVCEDLLRGAYLAQLDLEDHNALARLATRWERRAGRAPSHVGIADVTLALYGRIEPAVVFS